MTLPPALYQIEKGGRTNPVRPGNCSWCLIYESGLLMGSKRCQDCSVENLLLTALPEFYKS